MGSDSGDDDRTPPSTPRGVTARRAFDIDVLLTLAIGDLNVEMHPYVISPLVKEKLTYWLNRAWSAGRDAAERGSR